MFIWGTLTINREPTPVPVIRLKGCKLTDLHFGPVQKINQ